MFNLASKHLTGIYLFQRRRNKVSGVQQIMDDPINSYLIE
jgi:hypothetical protein